MNDPFSPYAAPDHHNNQNGKHEPQAKADNGPTFPPLFTGHCFHSDRNRDGGDMIAYAIKGAEENSFGAGDLIWHTQKHRMRFALILEPDISQERCAEMVYVAMVGFTDAIGALIPPEIALTYQWPHIFLMNEGQIGSVDCVISQENEAGIPTWMLLSIDIKIQPDFSDMNPGKNYHHTTLWDEGCGNITANALLESTARHLNNAIYTWSQEGFKPIHKQWLGRLSKQAPLVDGLFAEQDRFIGIDEVGNGLIMQEGQTHSHAHTTILNQLRTKTLVAPS